MWGPNAATGEHTVLRAGSADRIIDAVVQEIDQTDESLRVLLLTYPFWTTQAKLWDLITHRFELSVQQTTSLQLEALRHAQRSIQLRICLVLRNWLERHLDDFDDGAVARAVDWIQRKLATALPTSAQMLLQVIARKVPLLHFRTRTDLARAINRSQAWRRRRGRCPRRSRSSAPSPGTRSASRTCPWWRWRAS